MFMMTIILELLFTYKSRQHYQLFSFENLLRVLLFTFLMAVSVIHYETLSEGLESNASKEAEYLVKVYEIEDREHEISYYFAAASFIMWTMVLY